jgi:hypothetical protein
VSISPEGVKYKKNQSAPENDIKELIFSFTIMSIKENI